MSLTREDIQDLLKCTYQITETDKYPNIQLKFNKKMMGGKVEKGEMTMME